MSISLDENVIISEVHSRPVLWDPSNDCHNKRQTVKDAWDDLAKAIIQDFENLSAAKQREIMEQIRRKWHSLRSLYRISLQKKTSFPGNQRLSFLDRIFPHVVVKSDADNGPMDSIVWNGGKYSAKNVTGRTKTKRKKRPYRRSKKIATDQPLPQPYTIFLPDPVLSIKKLDAVQSSGGAGKVDDDGDDVKRAPSSVSNGHRRPFVPPPTMQAERKANVAAQRIRKSISYRESSPIIESDAEFSEPNGGGGHRNSVVATAGGAPNKCNLRYEVQMAAGRSGTMPARGASGYATLSFENGEGALETARRRVTPVYGYDDEDGGPAAGAEADDEERRRQKRMKVARSCLGDGDRMPSRELSPLPPTLRRHESYHDSRYAPMLPVVPIDYNDDDMAFFRSLLTWTRRFNEDEKLEFRTEVMKLVSRMRSYESTGNYYVISQTPL